MFEGNPLIPYKKYVRVDERLQKAIVKDILKILQDKCNSLKAILIKGDLKNIYKHLGD